MSYELNRNYQKTSLATRNPGLETENGFDKRYYQTTVDGKVWRTGERI